MKVGLILPMFGRDAHRVLDFARRAEDLGYDGVFAFDHFFPPGAPPDRPAMEAYTTLSAVAVTCSGLTVGTLVTRAGIRPAGMIAKLAAALDQASGGRMVLGIGTGDPIDKPEHEAYGLTYFDKVERRPHLAETIGAVRALFRGEPWAGGQWVGPVAGPLLPPPVTPGGPPIWIGGQAEPVVRMAAELADGWNGWGLHIPEFAAKAAVLREAAAAFGRAVEATWAGIVVVGKDEEEAGEMLNERYRKGMLETNVWAGSAHSLIWWLQGLATAGATWVVLVPAGPADRVEMIANEVLPELAPALS